MEVITVITPHVEHVPDDDSSFFWGKTHHFSRSFPWFSPCFNQGLQRCGLRSFAEATLKALLRQRERETRETREEAEEAMGKPMGNHGKTHGEFFRKTMGRLG